MERVERERERVRVGHRKSREKGEQIERRNNLGRKIIEYKETAYRRPSFGSCIISIPRCTRFKQGCHGIGKVSVDLLDKLKKLSNL